MPKYIKKPVEVEAEQFTFARSHEVAQWCGGELVLSDDPSARAKLLINTLEGEMTATLGDYVIKGVKGEFYPCKADIFDATYEPAPETRASGAITSMTVATAGPDKVNNVI